jgi:hypothetical protein
MTNDDRDLLTVLKSELEFLEKGGYWQSPSARWRPQFIFEDSPTCINHGRTGDPRPCSECILMNLVPADCRNERIPCRHIPLNAEGYTIDTYYRSGTQEEVEAAMVAWLRKIIEHLTALSAPAVNRESDSGVRSSAPSSRPG